jgi:hypothetical protein
VPAKLEWAPIDSEIDEVSRSERPLKTERGCASEAFAASFGFSAAARASDRFASVAATDARAPPPDRDAASDFILLLELAADVTAEELAGRMLASSFAACLAAGCLCTPFAPLPKATPARVPAADSFVVPLALCVLPPSNGHEERPAEDAVPAIAPSAVSISAPSVFVCVASVSASTPFKLFFPASREASSDSQLERKLSTAAPEEGDEPASRAPLHAAPCVLPGISN